MISSLFVKLFEFFNSEELPYVIMNGYDKYPYRIDSDIDICVKCLTDFEFLLDKASLKLNFRVVQKLNHHSDGIHYFISKEKNGLNHFVFSLDVYSSYSFHTKKIFSSDFFLKNRIKKDCFYISEEEREIAYYLTKKIIKQQLISEYYKFSNNIGKINENKFINKLIPVNKCELISSIEKHDIDSISRIQKLAKSEIYKRSRISLPLIYHEVRRSIKRLIRPTGFIVSILGPDGCGKTTIINELEKKNLPFRRIDYFHLRPRLLGPKGDGKPVINPHSKPAYGMFYSYLKLFYLALDYILGYWVKVRPLKVRSSLIIFDRYYDDLLVDPVRFRFGGSMILAHLVQRFIPKPDLTIVLASAPEIIYKRKKELSFNELKRQLDCYTSLSMNYQKLDVAYPPEELLARIESLVLELMSERK